MARQLTEKILDHGVENIHFFEGRLLTGRDLREQLAANRRIDYRLGRGIGAGVLGGLEVSVFRDGSDDNPPELEVNPGRAINAEGQTLELVEKERLLLTRMLDKLENGSEVFHQCSNPTETAVPNGVGLYILTLAPASSLREQAPAAGLEETGAISSCGKRYDVEGVQFRLVQLFPSNLNGISAETRSKLNNELLGGTTLTSRSLIRNLAAYLCFGAEVQTPFEKNPFAKEGSEPALLRYGALDELRESGALTSCDVPIALLYWTFDGIGFLDLWSVRRRALAATVAPDWPSFGNWRRRIEAEARLAQFQRHLEWLISQSPNPALIQAAAYFRYLPPAGFLPIASSTSTGVSATTFFETLTAREPVFMEGARVLPFIDRSFSYPAIDLTDEKVIWRYEVRENRQSSGPPYLVFAKAHLPYQGDAQFDVSHWDFSNYAPGVLIDPGS